MSELLRISFIVVALNAENTLPLLLSDLMNQTFPLERLELILVDSVSTDGTRAIMEAFKKTAPFPVLVLSNPKRWLASGNNIALAHASGDAIIRLDAHARIPPDFLQKNASVLERGENIAGGSVFSAPPETAWGSVMRAIDESRFCGGAAAFRNAGHLRYVDTLAYAMYRRSVFETVGKYDERLRRTEDNDMHYRMAQAGYRFCFCPDIVSMHAARDSFVGQARQKWGNGFWIGRTLRVQPRWFAPRHLIPAVFVLALLVALVLFPVSSLPLMLILIPYLALDLLASITAAFRMQKGRFVALALLPFLFPVMHLLYGTGTIVGLLDPRGDLNE